MVKYEFLDDEKISSKLLNLKKLTHIVSLYIPHIHCSSCIWILENLKSFKRYNCITSKFYSEKVRITYQPEQTNLKEIVYLLASIGYEPYISLKTMKQEQITLIEH